MTIHIVTSGKGNVGKSSFASALATVGAAAGANPQLIDADEQKQTLSKLYGEKKTLMVKLSDDPIYEGQPDAIWQMAESTGLDIIVDLAAQTDIHINRWMRDRGILDIAKLRNTRIIKWWVADLDSDSFVDLSKLCTDYSSDQITHVLVKSLYRGRDSLWEKIEQKNENITAAKKLGLKIIEFPRMFEGVIDKLRAKNQTFRDVMLDEQHKNIDMLNRSTVLSWIRKVQKQVEEVYQFTPVKLEAQKPEGKENPTPETNAIEDKVPKLEGDKGKSNASTVDSKKNEASKAKAK